VISIDIAKEEKYEQNKTNCEDTYLKKGLED